MSMLPCLVRVLTNSHFYFTLTTALMCWFVTLGSKMTGIEIPGVGLAPGGKIVKPEQEVPVTFLFSCRD